MPNIRHPQGETHPLVAVPSGYEWMQEGETLTRKCGYNMPNSPKFHRITCGIGTPFKYGYHYPMIQPISGK
jgi:hypothetical protein